MSNHPRTLISDPKEDLFIEVKDNVSIIIQALDDDKWSGPFIDLKNKIQLDVPEISTDVMARKIFLTLTGLCLSPETLASLRLFESRYYDMEKRIETKDNTNRDCTVSSENVVSYLSAKLSDNFGFNRSKNSNKLNQEERSTPANQADTLVKLHHNIITHSGESRSSHSGSRAGSDLHDNLAIKLAHHRPIPNRYVSSSAISPSNNLQTESFAQDLILKKKNKGSKVIERDKSPKISPPRSLKESGSVISLPLPRISSQNTEKPSRLPFLHRKKTSSQASKTRIVISEPFGFVKYESGAPATDSFRSLSTPVKNQPCNKALPAIPQHTSPPNLRHGLKSETDRQNLGISSGATQIHGDPSKTIGGDGIKGSVRSNYFPAGTATTNSKLHAMKPVVQGLHMPPSKYFSVGKPRLSSTNNDLDSDREQPERRSRRAYTTTNSVISSDGENHIRSQDPIYGNKKYIQGYRRQSLERPREKPRIVNIVRNPKGVMCVHPTDDVDAKKIRFEMSMKHPVGSNRTTTSTNSTAEISWSHPGAHTNITSEVKRADQVIKKSPSDESIPKVPNISENTSNNIPAPKTFCREQYSARSSSKEYVASHWADIEAGKNQEVNQIQGLVIDVNNIYPYTSNQNTAVENMPGSKLQIHSSLPRANGTIGQQNTYISESRRSSHQIVTKEGKDANSSIERDNTQTLIKHIAFQELHKSLHKPLLFGGPLAPLSRSPSPSGRQLFDDNNLDPSSLANLNIGKSTDPAKFLTATQWKGPKSAEVSSTTSQSINTNNLRDISKTGAISKPTVDKKCIPNIDNKSCNGVLSDITEIGSAFNPRTIPVGCNRFNGALRTPGPVLGSPIGSSPMKENIRPFSDCQQQFSPPIPTESDKYKPEPLEDLKGWPDRGPSQLSCAEDSDSPGYGTTGRSKERFSPIKLHGKFSENEVDTLMKRLSAQLPQTPDDKNALKLDGRYYTFDIPSLDKSPSKDEKSKNPIAVCMDLINAASNEPQNSRREKLLQMSKVMVDAVDQSREAERAAEAAGREAEKAAVAFLRTRKHLALMAELMNNKKQEI